jgi:hypothetical protein
MVADVLGNVMVVPSVPDSVRLLLIVNVLDAAPNARVPLFVFIVKVLPALLTPVPP